MFAQGAIQITIIVLLTWFIYWAIMKIIKSRFPETESDLETLISELETKKKELEQIAQVSETLEAMAEIDKRLAKARKTLAKLRGAKK